MQNVETVTGMMTIMDRAKTSRNGNPRFLVSITSGYGENWTGVLCYTAPDSSIAYEIQNDDGKEVSAKVGLHRKTVTLDTYEVVK